MDLINKHPFEIWQSQEVTYLLRDFFVANYTWAGINTEQAEEFVLTAWNGKNTVDREVLRAECAELLLKIKAAIKVEVTEPEPLGIIDLAGVETFLDIGANRLAAINFYGRKYPNIKKFIGVDVIPKNGDFMFAEKSAYYHIDPNATNFPIEPNSVDVILIQYSLHHFKDTAAIKNTLNICQGLLKTGGRLILMEESFTDTFDFATIPDINSQLGILTNEKLTKQLYDLDQDKRFEFIIANDWLINVHNPHMQWTGQYRTWEGWAALIGEHNLELTRTHNLGLRLNGRLKQGVHMIGEFVKI